MYGQMTAGSWIYIGSQGIVQGTYETFVETRPPALRRQPRGRAGSSPPASAAWAARSRWPPTMAGASLPGRSSASRAHRDAADAPAISTRRRRISTRRWPSSNAPAGTKKPISVGAARQRRRGVPRAGAARRAARRRDRPDLRARSDQRLSAARAGRSREWESRRERDPKAVEKAAKASMADARARHARLPQRGRADRRLRQQHPPDGEGRGRRPTPSISPASCRPTSARCSAAASGRSAGPRSRAIRRTSSAPTPR